MRLNIKTTMRQLLACGAATAVAAVISCGSEAVAATPAAGPKLGVVTTIYPVTYFTRRVGGDFVQVTSLVPSGVEAHDYEPKPSDIIAIQEAKVVVYTHAAFEAWMAAALESASPEKVVIQAAELEEEDATDGPEAKGDAGEGHDHGGLDPHVWLNPEDAAVMVERTRDGLIKADAANRLAYESNAAGLISQLQRLQDRISAGLQNCRLKTVVVSHEAYGHLLEGRGIKQVGLTGLLAEAGETGPRTIAEITGRMKAEGIKHVLVEPILSDALAQQVAAETGAALLVLHPLESLTAAELAAGDDYFTIMESNLQSLKTALECGP